MYWWNFEFFLSFGQRKSVHSRASKTGGNVLVQNKKERKKVREVGILKKDPESLKDQIQKLETMSKSLMYKTLHFFVFGFCCLCLPFSSSW